MADNRYKNNAGSVFSLKYHLVWCPKYRRTVPVGEVAQALERLFREKAAEISVTIHSLKIMPDHVHLFVESDPTEAPCRIFNQLKGYISPLASSDPLLANAPSYDVEPQLLGGHCWTRI